MQYQSPTDFQKLVCKGLSRRTFMQSGARFGLTAFVLGNTLLLEGCGSDNIKAASSDIIPTNSDDDITLSDEYRWYPVVSWGDPIFADVNPFDENNRAADQNRRFGDNNDGMTIFDVDGKTLLVVNNEYVNVDKMFPQGLKGQDDLDAIKAAFGVSIVELTRTEDGWQPALDGELNRRITMDTPMEIRGPARGHLYMRTSADPLGTQSRGTWSNCGNGETPWGTYLTCEENFNMSFDSSSKKYKPNAMQKRYRIGANNGGIDFYKFDERFDIATEPNEPNRMGYVVEIDPSKPFSTPIKRTALGRFMHENAEVTISKKGYIVVYMGDDARGEFLYKFVTSEKFNKSDKDANRHLLDHGTLYVAKFGEADEKLSGRGKWIELTHGKNGLIAENGFESQAEICIKTRIAASFVGATTMDRPEWVAAHPDKAEVCCALTNNKNRNSKPNDGGDKTPLNGPNPRENNLYGQIVRWQPDADDHASTEFNWDLFVLAGNPLLHKGEHAGSDNVNIENMFNSPDGLKYDTQGRLWIQTDGNFSNNGQFQGMGNNQMLVADTETGDIKRFMVGPRGSEATGITWSQDRKTLFVGIQHPGARGSKSHFPDGGDSLPRSTVIAIEHKDGKQIA